MPVETQNSNPNNFDLNIKVSKLKGTIKLKLSVKKQRQNSVALKKSYRPALQAKNYIPTSKTPILLEYTIYLYDS